MTHEELVEKVASEAWERMRQENLRENGDDLGPWFTPTPDWEDLPEAEHEAHYLRLPYVVDATAAISVVTEEAAKVAETCFGPADEALTVSEAQGYDLAQGRIADAIRALGRKG